MVTRMTVVRLADGALLLHGPVPRTPETQREIEALGPVRWIVAPNRLHHLYAGPWSDAPGANLYGAPGLQKKRKDLRFEATLSSQAPEPWAGQLEQELVGGLPILNEVAMLHRASRTLIVTDLFFNYPPTRSLLVRVIRTIEDCDGKLTIPRFIRLFIRDRRAFARSAERILSWDFDRIIVAHGDVVATGGHAVAEAELRRVMGRS